MIDRLRSDWEILKFQLFPDKSLLVDRCEWILRCQNQNFDFVDYGGELKRKAM